MAWLRYLISAGFRFGRDFEANHNLYELGQSQMENRGNPTQKDAVALALI